MLTGEERGLVAIGQLSNQIEMHINHLDYVLDSQILDEQDTLKFKHIREYLAQASMVCSQIEEKYFKIHHIDFAKFFAMEEELNKIENQKDKEFKSKICSGVFGGGAQAYAGT